MTAPKCKPEHRDFLLLHIDGPVPINRQDGHRCRTMECCVRNGWLRLGHPESRSIRPKLSYITEAGREALCKSLAAWADRLVLGQQAEVNRLYEREASEGLSRGVLEPAE